MADFRETQFEVLAQAPLPNWHDQQEVRYVYGDLEDAAESADNLREEGYDVEIWKLTIFEELL
jgi:hypothetical protein